MAPRDQVKATLKKLTKSYKEATKEFTKLRVPAAAIWFNHETNRLEVDGHGPIVEFLMQHLDEITQRPQFNIFTEEEIQRSQEYAPPSKPINDMTTKELKQYGVDLMIHLLGKKNKFSNPANKPYWWPADEPWASLQSGGADRYRKIICAYFLAERGINLATICATCNNECTNCKLQTAPSPTERPTTPVPHEPASSTGPPSSPLAPMTQVVSPEDTQPLELSSSPMTPLETSSSMVTPSVSGIKDNINRRY